MANSHSRTTATGGGRTFCAAPPPVLDAHGSTASLLGLLALITLCTGGFLSILLGIFAVYSSNRSSAFFGYRTPLAKTGRTRGIIAIVLGAVFLALLYLALILCLALGILYWFAMLGASV